MAIIIVVVYLIVAYAVAVWRILAGIAEGKITKAGLDAVALIALGLGLVWFVSLPWMTLIIIANKRLNKTKG